MIQSVWENKFHTILEWYCCDYLWQLIYEANHTPWNPICSVCKTKGNLWIKGRSVYE